MMAAADVTRRISSLARQRRYRLSLHAESERDADRITVAAIEQALGSDSLEMLEDYPEDARGHSHLVLGFTDSGDPIHAVCAIHEGILVIITVYRPDPRMWHNHRTRRKVKR